jgi:hypothetical protein
MTLDGSTRPDVNEVLGKLKDFQQETVDYVFRRLYTDPDPVSRFLIADEVGLGKTLVARGLIAKAVDHLWDTIPRIDVIYICSNQDIAQQNIDRLNITAEGKFQFASRATLLPITLQQLKGNKLNFVSLTPGTSFHLRSRGGWKPERAVLYALLREHWDVQRGTLENVLRGSVTKGNWRAYLRWFEGEGGPSLDEELRQAFYEELDRKPALREDYERVAAKIGPRRKHLTHEMRWSRNELVGRLRQLLARSSLSALEPDLVILDEFQRFKYLLEDEGDVALLARELFDFPDVKVLLLSATPYKMYTLQAEAAEDHYGDFYRTVQFLLSEQPEALDQLQLAIDRYRSGMLHLGEYGRGGLLEAKAIIESILRGVMVRTERLAASADRNGMLSETLFAQDHVLPADLESFVYLDQIANAVDAGDQVEYWKSAAYPLNLMDRYLLKRKFAHALEEPEKRGLDALLKKARGHLLAWDTIEAYGAVDPGNARLRAFWQESVETGNWQLLWMPASLPYYQPAGPFSDVRPEGCTKSLVFSGWRVVPKTISVLLSYEAERRMLEESDRDFAYSELTRQRRPLLTFALSRERLTGMRVFCLTYPCLALAKAVDPLVLAKRLSGSHPADQQKVFDAAKAQIGTLLGRAVASVPLEEAGRDDDDWYEGALALLDRDLHQSELEPWLSIEDRSLAWSRMLDSVSDEEAVEEGETLRYAEHVEAFVQLFERPERLGAQPENLVNVLTYMALGSPAIVALRAMLRVTEQLSDDQWPPFLAAAARIGLAFRTLFNQPDAISLVQSRYPEGAYWEKALRYSVDGNLQAVMDEYVHVLHESLGLVGHDPAESAAKLSESIQRALSLRAPTLRFDEVVWDDSEQLTTMKHGIRCRYALRFGDEQSTDYEGRTRDVDVRIAFNSPFRPFVLATTSIGQEGLDFHQYCHRVVHWNLPSNPVDLEQREGRVHRYKGHVIRRNLALNYGLAAVEPSGALPDPWEQLFQRAIRDRPSQANDLVPFWIYETCGDAEGGAAFKIERKVPVLPLSREIGRIAQLKRSLVAYRSVIGQSRQQELLEFLSSRLGEEEIQEFVDRVAIDLSPPKAPDS